MTLADFYQTLDLEPTAAQAQVRKAYLQAARRCHPDLVGDSPERAGEMTRVNEAYDVLRQPARRARWDQARARGVTPAGFLADEREAAGQEEAERIWRKQEDLRRQLSAEVTGRLARLGDQVRWSPDPYADPWFHATQVGDRPLRRDRVAIKVLEVLDLETLDEVIEYAEVRRSEAVEGLHRRVDAYLLIAEQVQDRARLEARLAEYHQRSYLAVSERGSRAFVGLWAPHVEPTPAVPGVPVPDPDLRRLGEVPSEPPAPRGFLVPPLTEDAPPPGSPAGPTPAYTLVGAPEPEPEPEPEPAAPIGSLPPPRPEELSGPFRIAAELAPRLPLVAPAVEWTDDPDGAVHLERALIGWTHDTEHRLSLKVVDELWPEDLDEVFEWARGRLGEPRPDGMVRQDLYVVVPVRTRWRGKVMDALWSFHDEWFQEGQDRALFALVDPRRGEVVTPGIEPVDLALERLVEDAPDTVEVAQGGGRPVVVVVDDDPEVARFASWTLTQAGLDARFVQTWAELAALLRREVVRCVVLDVNMPELSGDQMATKVQTLSQAREVPPILFWSVLPSQRLAELASRFSNTGWIPKSRGGGALRRAVLRAVHGGSSPPGRPLASSPPPRPA